MRRELRVVPRKVNSLFLKLLEKYFFRKIQKGFFSFLEKPNKEIIPHNSSPVIIIGMHRSGTTLLTRLLSEAGIHMGSYSCLETEESFFFQKINKAIFKLFHARWDNPEPLSSLRNSKAQQTSLAQVVKSMIKLRLFLLHGRGKKLNIDAFSSCSTWGWKDPRSTFTLLVWMRIFPNAKVIWVQRNGIEVAESLLNRNVNQRHSKETFSIKGMSFEGAFSIWEDYIQTCENISNQMNPNQILKVKYEELVQNPKRVMGQVLSYLGVVYEYSTSDSVFNSIDSSKGTPLSKRTDLSEVESNKMNNPLMVRLGYSKG